MKIVIVGTGVIGASIAYHAGRAGAEVTMVDGGMARASDTSFGWINASFYADAAHHRLRVAGLAAYTRLRAMLPDVPVVQTGALWFEAQGDALERMYSDLTALDYPVEKVSQSDAQGGEPALRNLPDTLLQFPSESAAEAGALARALIAASGARVIRGLAVTGLVTTDTRVTGITTDAWTIDADHVVLATGTGTPALLNPLGIKLPMLTRPGALVTTKPVSARISRILVTPHGEARQLPDSRILASAVANHQGDVADAITDPPEAIAARVLAWLSPLIDAPLDWDSVAIGNRPMPADGLPVIGAIGPDGLHIAVMHSGVTLAAITGEGVAAAVIGQGGHDALLAPYRPQRFQ